MSGRPRIAWIGLALAGACALLAGCERAPAGGGSWIVKATVPAGTDLEAVLHHNNLGVAQLERHHYAEAAKEFEQVVAAIPSWAEGHVNLGIARLSLHDDAAAGEFLKALEISPRHPYAHYGLGLLSKQGGDATRALQEFGKVLEVDPDDPDTLYNVGLLYAREGKHADAIAALRKTLAAQPANVSARFRLASSLLAAGQKQEGEAEMAKFKELSATGTGITLGLQYSEQGKYSFALTDYRALPAAPAGKSRKALRFAVVPPSESHLEPAAGGTGKPGRQPAEASSGGCEMGGGIAAEDEDSDGDVDLFLPGCGGSGGVRQPALFRNDGSGRFEDVTRQAGLGSLPPALGAAFADYDHDGFPDLAVSGPGGVRLLRNLGDGSYRDVTREAHLDAEGIASGISWADADHDGDLDLIVARLGAAAPPRPLPLLFYNNDGKGTFREVAAEKRVGRPVAALGATFSDLDDDRDVDFVLTPLQGPLQFFSNDRTGTFTELPGEYAAAAGAGDAATLADVDGDGWQDLVLPASGWMRNREGKGFAAQKGLPGTRGARGASAADLDNDMDLDLTVSGGGVRILENDGQGGFSDITSAVGLGGLEVTDARGLVSADLDGDGDSDLVVARQQAPPLLLRNEGGNLNNWLNVKLSGMHSNSQGAGTKVELHAGAAMQRREVRLGGGYLSQEPALVRFGLGSRAQGDFLRLIWPGGVLQSELEVSGRSTAEVQELDRKGSSCPILFGWDGKRYRFITDFLGTGGLGFLLRPGVYAPPDPDEHVKIEAKQLAPKGGYYLIQVLENLEEVSYLDRAQLWVVDHPATTSVFPNERFGGSSPPAQEIFEFETPILPLKAYDDDGVEVTGTLASIDRTYPDRFRVEERLPGFAQNHTLTLDFGSAARGKDNLVLFLYGWVDYGYSSSNLAAHQAEITPLSPRLEMAGPDGWQVLEEDMGYPAGLPRMMTVDLRKVGRLEDPRLRITTNLRVYWDQIFLAEVKGEGPSKITKLPAAHADLHSRGYPREHSPDGKKPLIYDYGIMDRTFPFRNMAGDYTRFGTVTDLLKEVDDRYVIFGRGEEITLKFRAEGLPPLQRGWKRDFLFVSYGYCKDMDPNTAFPDTVAPLPFQGMSGYPYPEGEHYPDDPAHREYLRIYNTRKISGRP
jgi:Tfp pilus assembly protein PilF